MLAAGGAAIVVAARAGGSSRPDARAGRPDTERTHTATLAVALDEVRSAGLPAPLAELGTAVRVDLREAPGGRGTEMSVTRQGDAVSDDDVREALRRSKALLETGEVIAVDPVPHGRRNPTPAGLLLDAVAARSYRKGLA